MMSQFNLKIYKALLLKLRKLVKEGKSDARETDEVRERIVNYRPRLTEEEKQEARTYSKHLWQEQV